MIAATEAKPVIPHNDCGHDRNCVYLDDFSPGFPVNAFIVQETAAYFVNS
jgi:hypothetical protein